MELELESILLPGIEDKRPMVIAGPCSAETEEQVMCTAKQLAEKGMKIFRAGIWKPRTKPGGFEGVGVDRNVRFYRSSHLEACIRVSESRYRYPLDWRTHHCQPVCHAGNCRCTEGCGYSCVCEEPGKPGSGTLDRRPGTYQQCRSETSGSHIGGKRELIAPLCQQAMDLGFNGLIIESHCNPDCAWSDASQQVTPDVLDYILNLLVIRKETQTTENLSELRKQIDECDNNLMQELAKRMRVAREIGTFKKEHDMTILQTGRYNEILDKRGSQGVLLGVDSEFIKKVFELIHEESVRQQMEIINK